MRDSFLAENGRFLLSDVATVRFWRAEVASEAEGLLRECGPARFPVDLTRLAVKRGITKIHFRPMLCDGAIGLAEDGFVVHIQSREEQLVPTSAVDIAVRYRPDSGSR